MQAPPSSTRPTDRANTLVALVSPACFDALTVERHRALLRQQPRTRLLVLATNPAQVTKIEAFARAGVPLEAVLAPDLARPDGDIRSVHAPSLADAEILALVLADVLVTGPEEPASRLLREARKFEKHIITVDDRLPSLPPSHDVTRGLDPDAPGCHSWGCRVFGRGEQAVLELLAFNWRGRHAGGIARSLRRFAACFGRHWRPKAYHGPDDWPDIVPDLAARDAASPLVAQFEALDRSAVHGAYIHRDQIWFTHIMAACAVVFAVGGVALNEGTKLGHGWAVAELITLLAVGLVIAMVRHTELHERWTACRLAAEQLRIVRMCLPVLAVPDVLHSGDGTPKGARTRTTDYTSRAIAQVKRAVRDHGLPRLDPNGSPRDAARWVRLIVADQAHYHRDNHHRLELVERRLNIAKATTFFLAVAAVVTEFVAPTHVLLFFTAAGPALAAALHGAETRLGIVHRAALSRDAHVSLHHIEQQLTQLIDADPLPSDIGPHIRALATRAAHDMGNENTSWHSLVRRQRDVIT